MGSEIKIGILIPQSKQYKNLDRDFIRGIKLNNLNARFFVESIGIGADDQLIIEKIQKLNFQEDVNIIIGFFGHTNINYIYEYASDNNILLIASDLGANMPYSYKIHKGVYINSYALTESGYLLGDYFAKNNYNKIASATSYYDSGYGILSSLESSLKDNVKFSGHYITPLQPRENEEQYMEYAIKNYEPDAVFGFFSGIFADETADFISKNKLTTKYPFFLTSFSVTDKIVNELKNDSHKIYVVTPWLEKAIESCEFREKYTETYTEKPSVFSLLGYENGAIISQVLQKTDNIKNIDALINTINNSTYNGPRGIIRFDNNNRTCFNHYIYSLEQNSDKDINFNKIETLLNNGDFINSAINTEKPAHLGGWHNAYLCH